MLRPASRLPEPGRSRKGTSKFEPDLREFQRQRLDVAIVEYPNMTPERIASTLSQFLRNHRDKYPDLRAAKRGNSCYLYREDEK